MKIYHVSINGHPWFSMAMRDGNAVATRFWDKNASQYWNQP